MALLGRGTAAREEKVVMRGGKARMWEEIGKKVLKIGQEREEEEGDEENNEVDHESTNID